MVSRDIILSRAKGIIEANPTYGKDKINAILKSEFGVGIRSSALLQIKRDVATTNPRLIPYLYRTGGVPNKYVGIYNGWRKAGFLPFEARELTIGHKYGYDAKAVFDSEPAKSARAFRTQIIKQQIEMGWTKQQIIDNIIGFYTRGKGSSPWEHIRAEYKPRKVIDFKEYRERVRVRAKRKQNRLLKGKM